VRGSAGSGSTGVRGTGGNGGWFSSVDLNGTGVLGSVTGNGHGVRGEAGGANGFGVIGTAPNGIGVVGTGGSVGVVAYQPSGYAGLFVGNLAVTGTLTKGAGAFRIDHPLDPAHAYLQHSFVESPDMKNVYDGIAPQPASGLETDGCQRVGASGFDLRGVCMVPGQPHDHLAGVRRHTPADSDRHVHSPGFTS
jgi:hypothetical protein